MHKLLLIIFIAFFVRAAFISNFPPALNWDEVSLGYNAYSLIHTGRDEWGTILPTIFQAYGDFKLPGYIYATIPFVKFFGLNAFSVRLTSVLSGTLLVLLVYILSHKLNAKPAGRQAGAYSLYAAVLMALSPWGLFLSRVAVEANFGILLFTLGIILLLYRRLFLGICFLVISAWTYNSFRIFVPIFFTGLFIFDRRQLKLNAPHYILFTILFIPILIQLLSTSGQARYQWLQIIDTGAVSKISELQVTTGNRFLYNKATYFIYVFAKNYISHFSPNFLFIKGGTHYQFSIHNNGLLYLVCLPFFYLGLTKSRHKIIWIWLVLAPIADSLTRDAPHALRSITLLPVVILITSLGLSYISRFKYIFIVVVALSTIPYTLNAIRYHSDYSWSWQYGYSQTVEYIKNHYSQYDEIIFTKKYGEPHEFFAFYWQWDPQNFQNSKVWDYHANWYWVNALDKIKFVNDWEMPGEIIPGKRYLVIASPDNVPNGAEIKRINFLDGKPAFIVKAL